MYFISFHIKKFKLLEENFVNHNLLTAFLQCPGNGEFISGSSHLHTRQRRQHGAGGSGHIRQTGGMHGTGHEDVGHGNLSAHMLQYVMLRTDTSIKGNPSMEGWGLGGWGLKEFVF